MEIQQTVRFKRKNNVFPHIRSEGYFHGAWKNHFHAKVEEPPPSQTGPIPARFTTVPSPPRRQARKPDGACPRQIRPRQINS